MRYIPNADVRLLRECGTFSLFRHLIPTSRHQTNGFSKLNFLHLSLNSGFLTSALTLSTLQPLALKTSAILSYSFNLNLFSSISCCCEFSVNSPDSDSWEAFSSLFTLVIQNICLCFGWKSKCFCRSISFRVLALLHLTSMNW